MRKILAFIVLIIFISSCVSKKSLTAVESERDQLMERYNKMASKCEEESKSMNMNREALSKLEAKYDKVKDQNTALESELEYLRSNNTNLLARLSDLSVLSQSSAESIQKSLETLNKQSSFIQGMTESIQRKDSINLSLVMNLKKSLADVNDTDVQVEVKKGVVYISLSDKMLFRTGSARIGNEAKDILGKIAQVINDHGNLDVLVEGHTDNVPISNDCISDNWDLSVKRATSVVRVLQNEYGVDPSRLTAGGRSEFSPKDDNATPAGKAANRRTEIIILPKLDQFFKLLEGQE
jgi:chemotaxis protein MotB